MRTRAQDGCRVALLREATALMSRLAAQHLLGQGWSGVVAGIEPHDACNVHAWILFRYTATLQECRMGSDRKLPQPLSQPVMTSLDPEALVWALLDDLVLNHTKADGEDKWHDSHQCSQKVKNRTCYLSECLKPKPWFKDAATQLLLQVHLFSNLANALTKTDYIVQV